jgi:RNA polymerase sigma factor (TIGR02999 family)
MNSVSDLLIAWTRGNVAAGREVIARTYRELRPIAHAQLRGERPGHFLQTTALLHEAFLRVLKNGPGPVESRDAFRRLMAAEIRRRLIDHARRRAAEKRGGGAFHEPLDSVPITEQETGDAEASLARLDAALSELSRSYPRAAQVVQLRFLAGMTTEETAQRMGISTGTVKREWTFARAWLASAIDPAD